MDLENHPNHAAVDPREALRAALDKHKLSVKTNQKDPTLNRIQSTTTNTSKNRGLSERPSTHLTQARSAPDAIEASPNKSNPSVRLKAVLDRSSQPAPSSVEKDLKVSKIQSINSKALPVVSVAKKDDTANPSNPTSNSTNNHEEEAHVDYTVAAETWVLWAKLMDTIANSGEDGDQRPKLIKRMASKRHDSAQCNNDSSNGNSSNASDDPRAKLIAALAKKKQSDDDSTNATDEGGSSASCSTINDKSSVVNAATVDGIDNPMRKITAIKGEAYEDKTLNASGSADIDLGNKSASCVTKESRGSVVKLSKLWIAFIIVVILLLISIIDYIRTKIRMFLYVWRY